MSVISPRRSSTSNSGGLYGKSTSTTGNTGTTGGSSSSSSSAYSSPSSYLNRASSLSKTTTPSSSLWSSTSSSKYSPNYYSSCLGSNSSSYSPRTASQRNSLSSSYLSGGSSGLGTYRTSSSYLSPGSNDTITSSRYGLPKSHKASDTLRKRKDRDNDNLNNNIRNGQSDTTNESNSAKKPPAGSRLSGSYSSSSLARLVATSGLEMYEKYSPANYKPNCELSRSSSTTITDSELDATNSSTNGTGTTTTTTTNDEARNNSDSTTTSTVTLERPRSRYSRLYSDENSNNSYNNGISKYDNDTSTSKPHRSSYRERAAAAAAAKQQANALTSSSSTTSILSHSSSNGDVPTATFTLRSNRTPRTTTRSTVEDNGDTNSLSRQNSRSNIKSNGSTNHHSTYNNDIENGLKELKLSNSGSGLYKDSSSNSITTTITLPLHTKATTLSASNSSGHLSTLTPSNSGSDLLKRNHSANNLDVADNVATDATNELKSSNNAVAGGAEIYSSLAAKTLDTPITAKKMNIRRPCGCH